MANFLQSATALTLSTPLTPCENFLAPKIAYTFQQATFPQLTTDTFIYPLLNGVDVFISRYLGFGEVIYVERRVSVGRK
jgi:hypothetical protein